MVVVCVIGCASGDLLPTYRNNPEIAFSVKLLSGLVDGRCDIAVGQWSRTIPVPVNNAPSCAPRLLAKYVWEAVGLLLDVWGKRSKFTDEASAVAPGITCRACTELCPWP